MWSIDEKRKYELDRLNRRKQQAIDKLGGKCVNCGTTNDLEFDHTDRTTKFKSVTLLLGYRDEIFWAEVAKCQLLCRPCHREKGIAAGDVTIATHGLGMYTHQKCRCDVCRDAWNAATRKYKGKASSTQKGK